MGKIEKLESDNRSLREALDTSDMQMKYIKEQLGSCQTDRCRDYDEELKGKANLTK